MAYEGVCFELSVNCPRCEKAIALNRVAGSVLCDSCRNVLELPVSFWRSVVGDAIAESLAMAPDEGRSTTMIGCGIGVTLHGLYGRQAPRCGNPACKRPIPGDVVRRGIESGLVEHVCPSCGSKVAMRIPPEWFAGIHPHLRLIAGESSTGDQASGTEGSEGIPFHCYHCGGSLSLDPENRTVECTYCGNQVTVPDEIWVRVNPAPEKHRWFAVLDIGDSKGALPGDTDSFCGMATAPDGQLIALYHADDDGEAGHPCRILRADGEGLLRWLQDGVEFGDGSTLLLSAADGSVCIHDDDGRLLRFIDLETGEPVGTVESSENDEDESRMHLDYCDIACDVDGTILHHRDGRALRRFDRRGVRLDLWPGHGGGGFLKNLLRSASGGFESPAFESLGNQPSSLPSDIILRMGWDGRLHIMSENGRNLATYDRDGVLLRNTRLDTEGMVGEVHDFGVDRSGRVFVLFEHSRTCRDTNYPHLGRILPGGGFENWAGPLSEIHRVFLGEYSRHLAVAPDGHCFVAYDFTDMRRISPDGEIVWRSPGTAGNEESQLEDLEQNMKGKRLVGDRS